MDYMTIKEASNIWNLSIRSTQRLCEEGKIEGVTKFGNVWAIPKDAERPKDGRIKNGKYVNWRRNN